MGFLPFFKKDSLTLHSKINPPCGALYKEYYKVLWTMSQEGWSRCKPGSILAVVACDCASQYRNPQDWVQELGSEFSYHVHMGKMRSTWLGLASLLLRTREENLRPGKFLYMSLVLYILQLFTAILYRQKLSKLKTDQEQRQSLSQLDWKNAKLSILIRKIMVSDFCGLYVSNTHDQSQLSGLEAAACWVNEKL